MAPHESYEHDVTVDAVVRLETIAIDREALHAALMVVVPTGPAAYLVARYIVIWKSNDVIHPNMDGRGAIRLRLGVKDIRGRVAASMFKEWR